MPTPLPEPEPAEVREQMERILSSPQFRNDRHKRFLKFLVGKKLDGRQDDIKEYTIGLEVFDKDDNWDAQRDSIVRVEAGRLREKLFAYYGSNGRKDPIRIELPEKGYVPRIARTEVGNIGLTSPPKLGRETKTPRFKLLRAVVVGGGLLLVLGVVVWQNQQTQKRVHELSENVRRLEELLNIRLGDSGRRSTVYRKEPSEEERTIAAQIPAEARPYEQALKSMAVRNLRDARRFLKQAEEMERPAVDQLVKIHLAYAETEQMDGRYPEGLAWCRKAYELRPEDPAVLDNLGAALYRMEKTQEARDLYDRTLPTVRAKLGSTHRDLGHMLSNLGMLNRFEERYGEAEQNYREAMAIWEKSDGRDSLLVARICNNLGLLYTESKQYSKAEPFLRRALEIRSKRLGAEHLEVAWVLHNLGTFYDRQEKYKEAEPFYCRAVCIKRMALAPKHPDLAVSVQTLGAAYYYQKQYRAALPLMEEAAKASEAALGRFHGAAIERLGAVGAVYYQLKEYNKAAEILVEALKRSDDPRGLKADDWRRANLLNSLADTYRLLGKFDEAERNYTESRKIWSVRKNSKLDVAMSLNGHAALHRARKHFREAESLDRQALKMRVDVFKTKMHPRIAQSLHNLGEDCMGQGRYGEALPVLKEALAIREAKLTADEPEVADTLERYAEVLRKLGRSQETAPFKERARVIRQKPQQPQAVGCQCGA